ncbi:MAG: tyrosine--tRNA ligase [Chlamydiota bacterium]
MSAIDYLEERDLIERKSSENLRAFLTTPRSFYIGFDPTADSLHLGNLLGIIVAKALQNYGHKPYILVGGATALIGDPSGKKTERTTISQATVEDNTAQILSFLSKIFSSETADISPVIVNNYDWFFRLSAIDFLRDIGKYFRLGPMLGKESVKARLESEEGMSFCEFSYQVLQANDFHELFSKGVSLQIGGSDQWGNMTAGIDFIRKKRQEEAYALTFPLLTDAHGNKLGKTEKGAIWLDSKRMSPYEFYQSIMKTTDQDVIRLLKMLTFLPIEEIHQLEQEMKSSSYLPNQAQRRLAEELTRFVHQKEGLEKALKVTKTARPGTEARLSKEELEEIAQDIPSAVVSSIVAEKFSDVALKIGLVSSKSEATRLVKNGGAYINNQRIQDPYYVFSDTDVIGGTFVLLSSGKKNRILVRIDSAR